MSIESITVSNVMVGEVKTARESQTVKAVAKIMTDNNIGSVVIVKNADASRPVGIITERDIVRMAGAVAIATGLASFMAIARYRSRQHPRTR
jgi:CBS domain-containing protein